MKIFACPVCGGRLYFRNLACACGAEVAFDPETGAFAAVDAACANRAEIACNWTAGPGGLCRSCAMTEVVPDTFHGANRALWAEAELSKRWVLATLGRWGWFMDADQGPRPVFHLLSEATGGGRAPVSMGHENGVVTINVTEADRAEQAARRQRLGERIRTMTGHFRHEIGHFLFARLSARDGFSAAFRDLFGDERADYGAALAAYYRDGPPPGWRDRHVTAYAASHPHEDWAESFAHLAHLADIADSFVAAGLSAPDQPWPGYDPYADDDAARLIGFAAHLGIALNHVNRAMGLEDIYPFVLTQAIRAKLGLVHAWARSPG